MRERDNHFTFFQDGDRNEDIDDSDLNLLMMILHFHGHGMEPEGYDESTALSHQHFKIQA